jgi:hypothetical protein
MFHVFFVLLRCPCFTGGEGYGGSGCWASGGGGGYSIISKRTNKGNQALLVAAGGGGGASLNGLVRASCVCCVCMSCSI